MLVAVMSLSGTSEWPYNVERVSVCLCVYDSSAGIGGTNVL